MNTEYCVCGINDDYGSCSNCYISRIMHVRKTQEIEFKRIIEQQHGMNEDLEAELAASKEECRLLNSRLMLLIENFKGMAALVDSKVKMNNELNEENDELIECIESLQTPIWKTIVFVTILIYSAVVTGVILL